MTTSFFLIQLIDKENNNGIMNLHRFDQEIFLLGKSIMKYDNVHIQGIEPDLPPSPLSFGGSLFSSDSTSIWCGFDIIPRPDFEDNMTLFEELEKWTMDSIYILRFLINLNLRAKMFFYVEIIQEDQENKKITIQKDFDPGCDSGSSFHINYNMYSLVFPLLTRLLNYRPTNKFKSIMYNNANAKIGSSAIIDYFYSFAAFEGIFHNWTEENGYSELWGSAIATAEEQNTLHEGLHAHFQQFLHQNPLERRKKRQLESFCSSTFPRDRKIRRTLRQRFKSYMDTRLTQEIRDKEEIQALWAHFRRIYSRRNEIGHSLENYTRTAGFIEDTETLFSSIKILMDFELISFIEGKLDWKFEERSTQLRDIISPMTPREVLSLFLFDLDGENQSEVNLRSRTGIEPLEKIEFYSNMELNEEQLKIVYQRELKMHYPTNWRDQNIDRQENQGFISIYPNPYFWLLTTTETAHYVFKTFEIRSYTMEGGSTYSKFSTDDVLMIIKAESIEIPDNSLLFSEEWDF